MELRGWVRIALAETTTVGPVGDSLVSTKRQTKVVVCGGGVRRVSAGGASVLCSGE